MKQLTLYFICLAMMLGMTACGSDEPDLDRQRDVTVSCSLTHVLNTSTNESTLNTSNVNTVVVHQRALTADFTLQATIDGAKRQFTVTGVPLKRVDYQDYRYTFNYDSASGDVKNLKGTVDVSDVALFISYDVEGHHVDTSIPDVFFAQTGVKFSYTDGTSTTAANSFWTLKVNDSANSANLMINDLNIARDSVDNVIVDDTGKRIVMPGRNGRFLTALMGRGAQVQPTPQGFKVTGTQLESVATFGDGDHVAGGSSRQTEDYIVREVALDVNMTTGRLDGTMVIRHVFKRDPDKNPLEWDDMNVQVSGETYKVSALN